MLARKREEKGEHVEVIVAGDGRDNVVGCLANTERTSSVGERVGRNKGIDADGAEYGGRVLESDESRSRAIEI